MQPELLVFTLGPKADSRRRRLLAEAHRQEEIGLRQGCLDAAVAAGREAGCRITVCSPLPLPLPHADYLAQGTGSFGVRLEAALEVLLARSSGPHMVVGADVPDLASRHLRAALEAVRKNPETVVLGPSPDGGIYLLALGRPIPDLAHAVRWGCPQVLGDLLRLLRAAGRPAMILGEALRDLDRAADLDLWLGSDPADIGRWRTLRQRLRRILIRRRRPLPVTFRGPDLAAPVLPITGRAPPLAPHSTLPS